ncbi:MAG: M23 family metallopeptidase [Dysosmobacter sp.]|nr:M23 family metallopeptidase [Dysosmobacter sp.]
MTDRPAEKRKTPRQPAKAAIPAWEEETPRQKRAKKQSFLDSLLEAWRDPDDDVSLLQSIRFALKHHTRHIRRRWRHIVHEKHAHNFPESERAPIQFLLFIWSMLPMAGSLLQERILGRRKRTVNRGSRKRRRMHPAVFLGGACAAAAVIIFCSNYTVGTTVTYDGEVIASVASQSAAEAAQKSLEKVTTRTLGETYTIDSSLIQYSSGLLRRKDVVDKDVLEEDLSEEIGLVTSAYCLYVDGEFIGATPYEGALEELLEQLQKAATNEDTISCTFAEDVEIKQEYVPTSEIMNLGYLAETLYSTKTAEVTYEVKKGDTWSEIAQDHGLTSKELLALNPGYNIDKLQIGEVLTLSASVPYLTMTVVQRERYVEDVMYDIEYTDSANLYKGDYKITSAGQYGAADVVATVTYVNGEETERTVLSSVTLREPVTEQRLQGTKERPTWLPTGSFRWPVSGRITSYFGGRKSPGGIGSTNHKGIDIAAPKGTPVYAADGGTVTYAGWMSGYGYLVRINHGNGYETYYGHNSSLTVSVGQHVYKGQQIARVGSTGNSTGNHCHFEVRYNGVAKNPLNYL